MQSLFQRVDGAGVGDEPPLANCLTLRITSYQNGDPKSAPPQLCPTLYVNVMVWAALSIVPAEFEARTRKLIARI